MPDTDVCFSHATRYKPDVERLDLALRARGIDVWFQEAPDVAAARWRGCETACWFERRFGTEVAVEQPTKCPRAAVGIDDDLVPQ